MVAVRGLRTSTVGGTIGIECSLKLVASSTITHERCSLRSIAVLHVISLSVRLRVTQGEAPVVKALQKQDDVGKSIVNGKDDLRNVSTDFKIET